MVPYVQTLTPLKLRAAMGFSMNRNLIVCSDGTGNAFAQLSSNVSSLIRCLDLRSQPDKSNAQQIAFYDQGVGTNPGLARDAHDYSVFEREAEMLKVLPEPRHWTPGWFAWLAGMAAGYGLRENIKEMVRALSSHYRPGDRIHLFGFSRGAFTVRALAGFLYRCWLPPKGISDFDDWFNKAFKLYEPHEPPEEVEKFRAKGVKVEIEFLGIWDTVKSYGGIIPISWPHLRHNPIVKQVRHALALDERRAWFQHTTWGSTREKLDGIPLENDLRYDNQVVQEVWFRGCHSDVGGGDAERDSAKVALLWMLGEATQYGLRLNGHGERLFQSAGDLNSEIKVHESFRWYWWPLGIIPRRELNNTSRPPATPWTMKPRVARDPLAPPWEGKQVLVHASAIRDCGIKGYRLVKTSKPPFSLR